MTYRFLPLARLELLEAGQWYLNEGGPALAERLEDAVQRALEYLQFMPRLGTASYPGVRTWTLKKFPYTLAYRVQGAMITVIAVAHQSREPGYWRGQGR